MKKTSKTIHKKRIKKVFEKNAILLKDYNYCYSGSLILFRTIPKWNKLPEDLDVAIDRNKKWTKELLELYSKLQKRKYVKDIVFMTVSEWHYIIDWDERIFRKREIIDVENISENLFQKLLESGNIRIEYSINNIPTEIFIEKSGNWLTNLWIMDKTTLTKKYKKTAWKWYFYVPFLSYESVAEWYAINFLKEIFYNNIYRLWDHYEKPKDGMRLNNIIALLKYSWKYESPKTVLSFIQDTVEKYSKLPESRRSIYIKTAIEEFSWIKQLLKNLIYEYEKIRPLKYKKSKNKKFISFYKKLSFYKSILHSNIEYVQKDILELLKKDIYGEKYIITDVVDELSHEKQHLDKISLKDLIKKINKVEKYIEEIDLTKNNESFSYFYEMYMFKNLFIKPIKNNIYLK